MTEMKTLVKKLCEVMGAVERVPKTGYNEFHKYKYATEADIVELIRGELSKRHVFIFPNVKKSLRGPLEVETTKWENGQKVPSVRKTQLTEVEIEWTFVDGESGEERTILVNGVGEDNVDKGFYKAFTGSEKYMLMKSFLIPTGDDPERDSKEDLKEANQNGKEAAKKVGDAKLAELEAKKKNGPTPALFFTWYDESQTASINGDTNLLKANEDILKPLKTMGKLIANVEQLEGLKYTLEQRGIPFHPLKAK
jgi:hypothetical protein